ncbi:hypothetical protein CSG_c680 [Campylobacter fetus subsp. venerealis str. 84-112]|nr:hypothetical protein CSG_c680 [Campylobacter fetus subsp. venerealis str. 84-112]
MYHACSSNRVVFMKFIRFLTRKNSVFELNLNIKSPKIGTLI